MAAIVPFIGADAWRYFFPKHSASGPISTWHGMDTAIRIFINSSRRSLKYSLLHNSNKHASIPVRYLVNMERSYEDMVVPLERITSKDNNWTISGSLKIILCCWGRQKGTQNAYASRMCVAIERGICIEFKNFDPNRDSLTPRRKICLAREVGGS